MREKLKKLASKVVKAFSKSEIIGKTINGSNKKLYYERSQHLTFLFKSKINYEKIIQSKIKKLLKEGDIVFDIGANIGQYAIPLSEVVGESGQVYSFEPDYKNFSFLQFNKNINRCNNITCLNYGVGGSDSKREFFRDTETGGRRGSFKKEFVGDTYKGFSDKVKLKTFDTIISEFGKPNFVKIDIEGLENEVINQLTIDLENCIFLVEVREDTKAEIFNYFSKRNYNCTCIDGKDIKIEKADEIPGFSNLVFKKASSQINSKT